MAVTRAEVAKAAGVSPAVVSYVINNGPRPVSAATRARVEAAVSQLDYRPNVIAAALNGSRSLSVGCVSSSQINPFFTELSDVLIRKFFEANNALLMGMSDEDHDHEIRYIRSFLDRRVDGLILTSINHVEVRNVVAGLNIPVVVVNGLHDMDSLSNVRIDNVQAGVVCTAHLQDHGHENIAVIAGPSNDLVSAARLRGWARAQSAAGVETAPQQISHSAYSYAGGYRAAVALLGPDQSRQSRNSQPTAIVAFSDVQALGALSACRKMGIEVPSDLAIVSMDGTIAAQYSVPELTTFRQPIERIAEAAVVEIFGRIEDSARPPATIELSGNLVIGDSCGAHG